MRPPQHNSPRPSSVSSCQSSQSHYSTKRTPRQKNRWKGGLFDKDICVGEELKIAVTTAVERFRLSEEQQGEIINQVLELEKWKGQTHLLVSIVINNV